MNESNTKGDGENSKRDSEIIIAGKKGFTTEKWPYGEPGSIAS